MRLQFTVTGYPPKKDGAQSMWGKQHEVKRLVGLREAALNALNGNPPLRTNIKLTLKIHVGAVNNRTTGDLDTFVTGVCDGLMAADPRAKLDPIWNRLDWLGVSNKHLSNIHPSKCLAIVDDCEVVYIQAEKIIGDTNQPWYEVTLEGIK